MPSLGFISKINHQEKTPEELQQALGDYTCQSNEKKKEISNRLE